MARKWNELVENMSPERRARLEREAHKAIASMPLAEIRKAIGFTQAELAERLDIAQGGVSKIEHAADMYLSTLRKYVEALGGDLCLTVTFPDGRSIQIDDIAALSSA
jgi:transcriptional regulator with XRE-family HTH domain